MTNYIVIFLYTIQSMEITGLRRTDTRLEEMMKFFKQLKKDRGFTHINAVEVGKMDFKK